MHAFTLHSAVIQLSASACNTSIVLWIAYEVYHHERHQEIPVWYDHGLPIRRGKPQFELEWLLVRTIAQSAECEN